MFLDGKQPHENKKIVISEKEIKIYRNIYKKKSVLLVILYFLLI